MRRLVFLIIIAPTVALAAATPTPTPTPYLQYLTDQLPQLDGQMSGPKIRNNDLRVIEILYPVITSPTPTMSPTPTASPTATLSPTPTATATASPTVTPTPRLEYQSIGFSVSKAATADGYLNMPGGMTCYSNVGVVMPGAGSIIGAAFLINCIVCTTPGTATIEVKINDSIQFSHGFSVSGTGVMVEALNYSIGTYTFSEDDLLQVDYTETSGDISIKSACMVRTVLD